MKVLVATKETQGQRENDFQFTKDGEIVYFGSRCTYGTVDDDCGCSRSLVGAETFKATTTVKVVDLPMTREQWVEAIVVSGVASGWGAAADLRQGASGMVRRIEAAIEAIRVGSVLEYRDTGFATRRLGGRDE